jgi:hypothetical protein
MHVHRTKRGRILEYWVLFFVSVRPYRCGKCRLRFYGPEKFPDLRQPDDFEETIAADDSAPSKHSESKSSRSARR